MKSYALELEDIEELVGPADTWPGRCHEIALAAASLIDDGVAVYGHYHGPVDPDGWWGSAADRPFIQHGWVKLDNGGVLDPTRWAFEDDEPELAIFDEWEAEDDYDEGGNRTRAMLMQPPPSWDPSQKTVSLSVPKGTEVEMALNTLFGEDQHGSDEHGGYVVTVRQAGWLANVPYDMLAPHTKAIYKMLDDAGLGAFVPIDNRQRAAREQ